MEIKEGTAAEIVKTVLEIEGISQAALAEKMGCVRQNVSQTLNRGNGNMTFQKFREMLQVCGYEIKVEKTRK